MNNKSVKNIFEVFFVQFKLLLMRRENQKNEPEVNPLVEAWLQTVGASVRALREKTGWNQDGLADAAEVSRGTISDLENGNRSTGLGALVLVLHAMKVDIWRMFGGPQRPPRPIEHQALHDLLDEVIQMKRPELLAPIRTLLRSLTGRTL